MKAYVKPKLTYESFALGQNIASCTEMVTFGPDNETGACGDWGFETYSLGRSVYIPPFYPSQCQCDYTAAKDSGFFSS